MNSTLHKKDVVEVANKDVHGAQVQLSLINLIDPNDVFQVYQYSSKKRIVAA